MPPENYRYQNKLQKPGVLGCSWPVLWPLPSKPLWWRSQGCSAGSKLVLSALPPNLQLQFLSAARWAVCDWGPCVFSQIPWLWERACLLEKSETGIRNASIAFRRSTTRLPLCKSSKFRFSILSCDWNLSYEFWWSVCSVGNANQVPLTNKRVSEHHRGISLAILCPPAVSLLFPPPLTPFHPPLFPVVPSHHFVSEFFLNSNFMKACLI